MNEAAVLSALLQGAETWSIKAERVRRLSGFHNRCIYVFELSWESPSRGSGGNAYPQGSYVASDFGTEETMAEVLMKHRLHWLGHLASMESH